jgi:hypothetical protein
VPPEERIATFDQDGTLWVEHPMYTFMTYASGDANVTDEDLRSCSATLA